MDVVYTVKYYFYTYYLVIVSSRIKVLPELHVLLFEDWLMDSCTRSSLAFSAVWYARYQVIAGDVDITLTMEGLTRALQQDWQQMMACKELLDLDIDHSRGGFPSSRQRTVRVVLERA